MQRLLLVLFLSFSIYGYSQITVDETLTPRQLIEDVLINNTCTQVSDIIQSTGTNFGDVNGIAAFDANGSDFPYASGIILSSGGVTGAPGPNLSTLSGGNPGWPGDVDLEANTTATNTNNASFLQFNFIPVIDEISFDFLLASEEYNQNFECTFSDAFAFILTDQITGGVQNLAVLPGTTTPIEVTNIHPDVPGSCPAINEQYFDKYNFLPFNPEALSATNYNGQIVSLVAKGTVVPGNTYTIKLVIADETDTSLDSAVFLRAGSFDIGSVDLGVDLTIAGGNARCEGEVFTIFPDVAAPPNTTYEWQYEDPIGSGVFSPFTPPETNPSLDISTTGNYKLIVNFGGNCENEGEIFVEFSPPIVFNPTPSSLVVCDGNNDGFAFFMLHDADLDITNGDPDLFVTYHPTQLDAENNLNELLDPYANDDPFSDVVYARVVSTFSSCFEIVTLDLEVRNTPEIVAPADPLRLCDYDTPGDGLEVFDLTVVEPEVLDGSDPLLYDIYYYEVEQDAIDAGELALTVPDFSLAIGTPTAYQNATPFLQEVYILVVGNGSNTTPNNGGTGCYSIVPLTLIVDALPAAVQPEPYELCDDEVNGSTLTDQISTFDLTTREGEVTGGDGSLTVTWYETVADEAADLPIAMPSAYQNRAIAPAPLNPQTIIARVTGPFGCKVTVTLTLVVNPNPTTLTPDPLVVCDDDNDGYADFVLHDADLGITGGDPDLTITYHPTYLDAVNNLNELIDPYTNDDPYNDVVFAHIVNVNTLCSSIVPLTLEVRNSPVVAMDVGPLQVCDYNNSGDGIEFFDLTLINPSILDGQDPLLYDFYYYEVEQDAIDAGDVATTIPDYSQAIGTPLAYQNTTPFSQIIYVLVVGSDDNITPNNGEIGCYAIVPLELVVAPVPAAIQPQPYELCDDEIDGSTLTDQKSTFDLTTRTFEITGGDPDLSVTWYETAADELSDTPIATPNAYQNRAIAPAPLNPQTIIGRVTSGAGCKILVTLTLVVNPNPTPVTPEPLYVCDDDEDGLAEFPLNDRDLEIIGGEPGVTVVGYFFDEDAAKLGDLTTALAIPYLTVVPNQQTVWARVEITATGCYGVVPLDLIVNPLPDFPTADFGDLLSCDSVGGGSADFNLEENTPYVYGVQDPLGFAISYYDDPTNAEDGINNIVNTTAFASTGQTIWVRLENLDTGCYRISSFELIVGIYPIIGAATDLELCDDDTGGSRSDGISTFDLTQNDAALIAGDPDLTVFYYATAADQQAGISIATPDAYPNTETPQTIYVSVFNSTECSAETSFVVTVNPSPASATPTPLVACDENNDGFSVFTLTDKDAEIIAGEPGVTITYHETYLDADNGTFALTSPYSNIVANNQIVYARTSYEAPPTATGCYGILELELQVVPAPVLPTSLPDLVLCDDDGFGVFDLTQQEPLIYGTQNPSDYSLSYHTSQADADLGVNPILTPDAYTNVFTPEETIYIRLSVAEDGCYRTMSFLLRVSLGPTVVQPDPLTVCDDLGEPNDGIATFDLTQKNDEITGGVAGVEVSYYQSQEDADQGINAIDPAMSYVNTTNPEIVFVRVVDGNTECFDTSVRLTLRVVPRPNVVTPAPLEACDETIPLEDGIEEFDLTEAEAEILNGASWDVHYYESYPLALDGDITTAIVDPTAYSNDTSPFEQTIYVRVTVDSANDDSCFEIVELLLLVHPLPDDTAIVEPYQLCEVGTDGIGVFDLTTKIPEILGEQDPLEYAVTFYRNSIDAETRTNPIVNTTAFISDGTPLPGQEIYTGIEHIETGCYVGGVQLFNLEVLEGATATQPAAPYIVCDDEEGTPDGFTAFNLPSSATDPDPQAAALAEEILGGQTAINYVITWYETLDEAVEGIGGLPGSYTNIINPQIVYARVTNTDTGCYEIVEVILKVEQLPAIVLEEEYRLCVDANENPIPEVEGEMSPPFIDTGLDPNLYDIIWEYPGGTAIGPSITAIVGGIYSVTYTEIATGCSVTETTTVIVSQPPMTYEAILVNGAFSDNHVVQATATGLSDSYVYQLDDGEFIESGTFENVSPGTHTVTFKDARGCGSVTIEIGVIDYPKFITPNQDGYHDTWNIIGIASFDPTAKIYIFDRFGKLLKQISPIGAGWDGTYNGNSLPSSDYWFVVEYTEQDVQKEFKGHFTLKR